MITHNYARMHIQSITIITVYYTLPPSFASSLFHSLPLHSLPISLLSSLPPSLPPSFTPFPFTLSLFHSFPPSLLRSLPLSLPSPSHSPYFTPFLPASFTFSLPPSLLHSLPPFLPPSLPPSLPFLSPHRADVRATNPHGTTSLHIYIAAKLGSQYVICFTVVPKLVKLMFMWHCWVKWSKFCCKRLW